MKFKSIEAQLLQGFLVALKKPGKALKKPKAILRFFCLTIKTLRPQKLDKQVALRGH